MKQKNNGFGLLELMVAMAVMAIIAAFALPSVLSWRENAELRAVTEDIRKTMKLARSRAVKDNEIVVVDFDVECDGKWDSYWAFVDREKNKYFGSLWGYDSSEPVLHKKEVPEAIAISFIDPVTGKPSDSWQPSVSVMYPKLLNAALNAHNNAVEEKGVAGGLFPVDFQESKISFKPPTEEGGCYETLYDGQDVSLHIYSLLPRYKILFDPSNKCLTPLIIELVNVKGRKYQIEITAYGISKATRLE